MTRTIMKLQDLRRKIYVKAKEDKIWRFWGLYIHGCKEEILKVAYKIAKENNGDAGTDGTTFEAIEKSGVEWRSICQV